MSGIIPGPAPQPFDPRRVQRFGQYCVPTDDGTGYELLGVETNSSGKTTYSLQPWLLHREGGPAVTWADGTVEYWQHGQLHRTDGPAVLFPSGESKYFLRGLAVTGGMMLLEFLKLRVTNVEEARALEALCDTWDGTPDELWDTIQRLLVPLGTTTCRTTPKPLSYAVPRRIDECCFDVT